jgi:hypothetical protein
MTLLQAFLTCRRSRGFGLPGDARNGAVAIHQCVVSRTLKNVVLPARTLRTRFEALSELPETRRERLRLLTNGPKLLSSSLCLRNTLMRNLFGGNKHWEMESSEFNATFIRIGSDEAARLELRHLQSSTLVT